MYKKKSAVVELLLSWFFWRFFPPWIIMGYFCIKQYGYYSLRYIVNLPYFVHYFFKDFMFTIKDFFSIEN